MARLSHWDILSALSFLSLVVHGERFCVHHLSNGEFINNVKCINNDTYCGDWNVLRRTFTPLGCKYREVTTEQALMCLANRTIAFIGDSQLEGLSTSLGLFLYGYDENAPLFETYWKGGHEDILDYLHLKDPGNYDWGQFSTAFPTGEKRRANNYTWQVITFGTRKYDSTKTNLPLILNNNFQNIDNAYHDFVVRPIDFAVVNAGLHSKEYFNSTPYGENYFNSFVKMWLDVKDTAAVPSVYAPMNYECPARMDNRFAYSNQPLSVAEANWYTHKRLLEMKLPFFDLSTTLKVPQVCDMEEDGVHIWRWAEIINAKILLNYLCDHEWNWVGSVKPFIGGEIL